MTVVRITVIGVPNFQARLLAAAALGETALTVVRDALGEAVEEEAKRLVPVLTGDLKKSITYDKETKVYTDVVYAKLVEYGGPHNPVPKPYMRPAADTVQDTPALMEGKAVMDRA